MTVTLAGPIGAYHGDLGGETIRVSVPHQLDPDGGGGMQPSISDDGRFVAFVSSAGDLVARETHGSAVGARGDIYVRDVETGTTELVSVASGGEPANSASIYPVISGDGRYVSFLSHASNLVDEEPAPTEPGYGYHLYIRDRVDGTTFSPVTDGDGRPLPVAFEWPEISGDGRYVVARVAEPLDPDHPDREGGTYRIDTWTGEADLVEIGPDGDPLREADAGSAIHEPDISSHGTRVVFRGPAGDDRVYLRDLQDGTTRRLPVPPTSDRAVLGLQSFKPAIDADGTVVAVMSYGPGAFRPDIVVHDLENGTRNVLRHATHGYGGLEISPDGRYVTFETPGAIYGVPARTALPGAYVWDRVDDETTLVSVRDDGTPQTEDLEARASLPDLSHRGERVVFTYDAPLEDGDGNDARDIYLRDLDVGCEGAVCTG